MKPIIVTMLVKKVLCDFVYLFLIGRIFLDARCSAYDNGGYEWYHRSVRGFRDRTSQLDKDRQYVAQQQTTPTTPLAQQEQGMYRRYLANIFELESQRESKEEEYGITIDPFQVMIMYNTNVAMSDDDEMSVLTTTQSYLSSVLSTKEQNFSRLMLYQYVRDYPEVEHYAKVAFGGVAYFFGSSMEKDSMRTELWLSLMGQNSTKFVLALQDAGMKNVVNATLMSIDGNELGMKDGIIVEMDDDNDKNSTNADTSFDRSMSEDDMTMMTLLLSLLIPGGILSLACTVCLVRSVREINWTKGTNTDDTLWQTSQHN